jgi:sulfur carrier protein ThiS
MPVHIIPVGYLRSYCSSDAVTLDVGAGKTIEQILAELDLNPDLVAMVLVNDRQAPASTTLVDGDVVKLIPFIGGG